MCALLGSCSEEMILWVMFPLRCGWVSLEVNLQASAGTVTGNVACGQRAPWVPALRHDVLLGGSSRGPTLVVQLQAACS